MIFDKDDFKAYDADLWNAIAKEEERQQNNIELIASENVVSKAVMVHPYQQVCRRLPRPPVLRWDRCGRCGRKPCHRTGQRNFWC